MYRNSLFFSGWINISLRKKDKYFYIFLVFKSNTTKNIVNLTKFSKVSFHSWYKNSSCLVQKYRHKRKIIESNSIFNTSYILLTILSINALYLQHFPVFNQPYTTWFRRFWDQVRKEVKVYKYPQKLKPGSMNGVTVLINAILLASVTLHTTKFHIRVKFWKANFLNLPQPKG